MPVVQQRAEQWRARGHTAATLRECERCMFMVEQSGQPRMGVLHAFNNRRVIHVEPDGQRVDEQAERPIGAITTLHASEQHGAGDDLLLATGAGEHTAPGDVTQTRETHAQTLRLDTQTLVQRSRQHAMGFIDTRPVLLHLGEAEGQCGFAHLSKHAGEEVFVFLFRPAEAGLRDQVTERHRRGQRVTVSGDDGLHLLMEDLERGVIADQVMPHDLQDPSAVALLGDGEAQQRSLGEVEPVVTRVEALRELIRDSPGTRIEVGLCN